VSRLLSESRRACPELVERGRLEVVQDWVAAYLQPSLRDLAFRGSVVERSMPPPHLSPGGGALWLPLLFGGCHPSFEGPF
jgi:hypothetical protein